MTGQAAGWESIKVWRQAANMAACLTLLQITGVDLANPQSKTLARMRGLFAKLT
jgi:hypothetical protein